MRRWWLVAGLVWLGPSPGAIVIGDERPQLAERVLVRIGADGLVETIVDASFPSAADGAAGNRQLLYAVPDDVKQVDLLADSVPWPDPKPAPIIRRPWMLTSLKLFLQMRREQAAPPTPTAPSMPILASQVTAPSVVGAAALQQLALTDAQRTWATSQVAAGRKLVAVDAAPGPDSTCYVWPVRFTSQTAPAQVPFSAAQPAAVAGPSTEAAYTLLMLADDRVRPTYPDGYAPFPELALQCAEPNPAWLGGLGPAKYATLYQANVPLTARTADLVLAPFDSSPLPPPEPRIIDLPRPIPLDAILGVLLLAGLLAWAVRLRRRKAGTTSSAT